jgi:group II intron reverse transcriptase/maturase
MPTLAGSKEKVLKRQKLRNNEYYDTQAVFDSLHEQSLKSYNFKNLLEIITSEQNILLAYRNLRKNKGSKTSGVDGKTITDISKLETDDIVRIVQERLKWYVPQAVRRVEIPKENDPTKTRPLGIPTIMDRLIQQSIMQVLEPICEAKFHESSNGFRPNRGAENALAQLEKLIQMSNLHFVVDIDIKGFFDNVSHGKLIKQMWAMGIREKKLISIISSMLKAEVAGIGFSEKGTPQGGVISPLLSNIVLNELDWWITSQWEGIPTRHKYVEKVHKTGTVGNGKKYRALRKTTTLKECYIIRYADDFKIVCRTHADAVKMFEATKKWLKDRLGLEVSPEKSKIINLKHQYSDFLGFKLKVHKKGFNKKTKEKRNKWVVVSHVSDKALAKIHAKAKKHIKSIQFAHGNELEYKRVNHYNSYVMGIHNYYRMATAVNADFQPLAYGIKQSIKIRLQERVKRKCNKPKSGKYAKEKYGKSKEIRYVGGNLLVPIGYIRHSPPVHKKKSINKFTTEGRKEIHKALEGVDMSMVHSLMRNPVIGETAEYNDNRISLYVAQRGKCGLSAYILDIDDIHCHHKKMKCHDGTDAYSNLIILSERMHRLVHATDNDTISDILSKFKLDKKQFAKLNKLRKLVENEEIDVNTMNDESENHNLE